MSGLIDINFGGHDIRRDLQICNHLHTGHPVMTKRGCGFHIALTHLLRLALKRCALQVFRGRRNCRTVAELHKTGDPPAY